MSCPTLDAPLLPDHAALEQIIAASRRTRPLTYSPNNEPERNTTWHSASFTTSPAARSRSTRLPLKAVHPADGSLPPGQIYHAAGSVPGGWTIIAIHDSQAAWEKFRDGTLLPKLQAGVEGGFTTPPQETEIEIDHIQP